MQVPVFKIRQKEFIEWLENQLNNKYDIALEGLKLRFLTFYSIIKGIIDYVLELRELVENAKIEKQNPTPLINNCLQNKLLFLLISNRNILKTIIMQYPRCLDLEFCEEFLKQIQEQMNFFVVNFHPLTHFKFDDIFESKKNDKVESICKQIEEALEKITDSIDDIEKRAELAVPLLKHLENVLRQFRIPVKIIIEEIKLQKQNKVYKEYQTIFNDFMKKSIDGKNIDSKGKLVKQMMKLIKEACYNQLQLDTILETPKKLCQVVKTKGRKILSSQNRKFDTKKILEFAGKMVKQDFIFTYLTKIPFHTLVQNIKFLEGQKKIINEIRKQPMFLSGIDEIKILDEQEFKSVLGKWLKSNVEINQLLQDKSYQEQFLEYKSFTFLMLQFIFQEQFQVSVVDLRKFSQKLWEFQKSIVDFQKLLGLTKKLNNQVQKICFKEFKKRVEITFDDLESVR